MPELAGMLLYYFVAGKTLTNSRSLLLASSLYEGVYGTLTASWQKPFAKHRKTFMR